MNMLITFPNGDQFETPLRHIAPLRIKALREARTPGSDWMHNNHDEVVKWAFRNMKWSQLKPLLQPQNFRPAYNYRTLWSAKKVNVTYR